MLDERLALSQRPGGAHHALARLAGDWIGVTETWFEPNKLADRQEVRATIRPFLAGRFLLYEYESQLMGQPRDGLAIIGFNLGLDRYEIAWIDTAHMGTGIMYSIGGPGADEIAATGAYPAGDGPPWGWRTTLTRSAPGQLIITMFNIPPGGTPYKGVETRLSRLAPAS